MTPRLSVNEITSDQLDALYDQLDAATRSTGIREAQSKRRKVALDRMTKAWLSARRRGKDSVWRATHDRLWSEFGKDRARADTAEAALDRVRQLHRPVDWRGMTICPDCSALDPIGDTTDNRPVQYEHCSTITVINGPKEN